jgi:N-acetylglucosamine-6-phosphate deacetylase
MAPPLFDLQVNGFAGIDFQQDTLTTDQLLQAVRALQLHSGCSRFFLTLITDHWTRLLHRLAHLRALRQNSPVLSDAIAGWHLEGPFLSSEPGFCGAHDPGLMLDPTPDHLRDLRTAAGHDPLLLTLAPERPGALEAIPLAIQLGCQVSLGHTNASTSILERAIAAGAGAFTHLGNACPQLLDRHDNILWRMLDLVTSPQSTSKARTVSSRRPPPPFLVTLIPDALHVAPALFRLIHHLLGPDRIVYVSDATAAAAAPPGRYSIGQLPIDAGPDHIVRRPGQANFAGSALRPVDGVFRAAQMLGMPWQALWDAFSLRPARFVNLATALEPGAPANFCLLDVDESRPALLRLRLFRAGEQVA